MTLPGPAAGRVALALTVAALAACRPVGVPPAVPPAPALEPEVEVTPDPSPEPTALMPPSTDVVVDELLASRMLREPSFRAEVEGWIEYWTGPAASWFPDFLGRMAGLEATVDSALAANGLPASLRYLPLIESGYNPGARSHAAAVGLWQLMAGTATDLGVEVGPLVDDRRDPFVATGAAIRYLSDLHDEFGSWFLTLAAYNGGPGRARRIVRRQAPLAQVSDSLFWALRHHFPRETREFVPKLVGAIVVAGNPAAYGFDRIVARPFEFDEVTVPDATTLDVVARAAGTSQEEIVRLNPEVVKGITPPGQRFTLRVPAGAGRYFDETYALVPPDERVTFVEHTVATGETLSHIAVRYRVSVSDLVGANPSVRPRFLRVGTRLTVPITPAAAHRGGS